MKRTVTKLLLLMLVVGIGFSVLGCENKETSKPTEVVEEQKEDTENEEVVEENNLGLIKESSMELDYAEHFKVDYYEGGYKIITDSSDREILLVPEGKEVPELDRKMLVLQMPIDSVAISSTVDACWFRPINSLDKITGVVHEEEKWDIEEMAQGLKEGNITFMGSLSALDYEVIQGLNPDIFLLSTSRMEEISPKFDELDTKYLSMGAYLEDDPRGRLEWVKLAGALLDKEEGAFDYYNSEIDRVKEIVSKVQGENLEKPKVANAYFSASKELFRVTHGKGHTPVTTELAGGIHYPENFYMEERGGSDMTNEEFYATMEDVDILIYDKASGHAVQNKEDLLRVAPFVEDLDVVKENRIYMIKDHYWQSADKLGDIIESLHEIFSNPWGEVEETEYHIRIDRG